MSFNFNDDRDVYSLALVTMIIIFLMFVCWSFGGAMLWFINQLLT